MFLGMQGDHIAVAAETREEIENTPCMEFTQIIETDEPVAMVAGRYYIGMPSIKSAKCAAVRQRRNDLVAQEVDPIATNQLRWADLSDDEKQQYADYRKYLLDYPESGDEWYENNPLTFDEWVAQSSETA